MLELLGNSSAVDFVGWGGVIVAIGGIVTAFLRYITRRDSDAKEVQQVFAKTVETINDRNLDHHRKLAQESTERSQSMKDCMVENNRLIGRTAEVLGRATEVLDRHDRLLSEYEQQGKLRSNT